MDSIVKGSGTANMSDFSNQLVDILKTKVSEFRYNQWLKPARFSVAGDTLKIQVPNKFLRDWVRNHYLSLIEYEAYSLSQKKYQIEFTVDPDGGGMPPRSPASPLAPISLEDFKAALPAEVFSKEIEKSPSYSPVSLAPMPSTPGAARSPFNPKYAFDTFVVGSANQFCHAASLSVASHPGQNYNPLFIYGGVGLGKTHLLHAIGLHILKQNPKSRVLFTTGEQFTNDLINAIRYETTHEFRKKYRESLDVLLIDDIQFISGKERTQEAFFHTFNTLYESRRQIVLTSDRSPKDIPQLEERLRSRFNWGLIADIQIPDIETRMAILRRLAERNRIELPDAVAYLMAERLTSNIRDLEGSFNRLSAFASLSNSVVCEELAEKILQDLITEKKTALSFDRIQDLVAEHYKLDVDSLKSKRRFKTVSEPRQVAMYLCKKYLKASFPEIGHHFGGKDHTTVIHAVRKITREIDLNPEIQSAVAVLEKYLTA